MSWLLLGAVRCAAAHTARTSGSRVVVYCVHGHEVSQGIAAALSEDGLDAGYLIGGIEGWSSLGQHEIVVVDVRLAFEHGDQLVQIRAHTIDLRDVQRVFSIARRIILDLFVVL